MQKFYVHFNGAAWFVKEAAFFEAQGGLTDEWGAGWTALWADSVEHARLKAQSGTL